MNSSHSYLSLQNKRYLAFLYLLWPFSFLLLSVRKIKTSLAANLIWAFCAYFAYSLSIADASMDANRLVEFFLDYKSKSLSLREFVGDLYNEQGWAADILLPLLQFTLAELGASTEVYLAVLGLVFGYFYSRNLSFVSSRLAGQTPRLAWLFYAGFALSIPFWYINGFRFWTAAHIFIFGVFRYLDYEKRGTLLLAASSMLVHFSFLFPVAVLAVYVLLKNRTKLYMGFLLFSTLFSGIDAEVVQQSSPLLKAYLPVVFEKKISGYAGEQYVEKIEKMQKEVQLNWYAAYRESLLRYLLIGLCLLIYIKRKEVWKTEGLYLNWFSFALLFFASTLLLVKIPSGGRFVLLAYLLSLGYFSLVFNQPAGFRLLSPVAKSLSYAIIGLYMIVEVRSGFDSISLDTLFSNPILVTLWGKTEVSLIHLLK